MYIYIINILTICGALQKKDVQAFLEIQLLLK